MRKNNLVGLMGIVLALSLCINPSVGLSFERWEWVIPVQIPYEPPPKAEIPDIPKATPAPAELSDKDRERLESLIPLLEGQQEYWAIGEFVHYGKHSVPYLVKALKMPGPRLRYNAIETLSIIKEPSSVPGLLEVATDTNEMSRIRSHAIRTASRIDPSQVLPAIKEMVKDPNSTIRSTAVYEARRVRQKEILPIIIGVIPDPEQYVSITARDSFWVLTGFIGSAHDWEISTEKDRKEWTKEWWAWWEENKSKFDGPPPSKPSPKAEKNPDMS